MSSMIPNKPLRPAPVIARDKLLEAAAKLIRTNGYSATSAHQLCGEAGVTRGAFFPHFASNAALGVTTAPHWSANTGAVLRLSWI